MTEQTDVMKELGLEVQTDKELLWNKVIEETTRTIKNYEDGLVINKSILELAQSKLKVLNASNN